LFSQTFRDILMIIFKVKTVQGSLFLPVKIYQTLQYFSNTLNCINVASSCGTLWMSRVYRTRAEQLDLLPTPRDREAVDHVEVSPSVSTSASERSLVPPRVSEEQRGRVRAVAWGSGDDGAVTRSYWAGVISCSGLKAEAAVRMFCSGCSLRWLPRGQCLRIRRTRPYILGTPSMLHSYFHLMWPPDGLKDTGSPFLSGIYEKYAVLLFWMLQIKLIYVIKLETFSLYVAPLTAWKTRDHLFFKELTKNMPCFYFEGFKLNWFML